MKKSSLGTLWAKAAAAAHAHAPGSPTAAGSGEKHHGLRHPRSPRSPRSPRAPGSRWSHWREVKELERSGLDHGAAVLAEFKHLIEQGGLRLPPEMVVAGDLDATLRRFLRARKFKLEAAYAMLEKSLAWRARVGADTALRTPLPSARVATIRDCRPSSYVGFHREGYPIFIERLGMLNGDRIEQEGIAEEQILELHVREMEFMAEIVFAEASRRAGRTIDRGITIMDAQGLTFSMLTGFAQRLFRALASMDSDNYPETCHQIYIVNNSTAFSAVWRVLKVFVDAGTRDKIKVLGSGDPMLAALLQEFDASQIPSFLGGALDYDERRRQWLELMDAVMAEAAAAGKAVDPVCPSPALADLLAGV